MAYRTSDTLEWHATPPELLQWHVTHGEYLERHITAPRAAEMARHTLRAWECGTSRPPIRLGNVSGGEGGTAQAGVTDRMAARTEGADWKSSGWVATAPRTRPMGGPSGTGCCRVVCCAEAELRAGAGTAWRCIRLNVTSTAQGSKLSRARRAGMGRNKVSQTRIKATLATEMKFNAG